MSQIIARMPIRGHVTVKNYMNDYKSFLKKILFPPLWLIIILIVFSASALVFVFAEGFEVSFVACVVYVVSFYTLAVFSIVCTKTFPRYYQSIRNTIYANQYTNRYFTDPAFKTQVSLHISLVINLLYIAVNAFSAFYYKTAWFVIFAVYYCIMAFMRFLLVRYVSHNSIGASRLGELIRSRLCAYIMMMVNIVLSAVVLMMVYHDRGFEYQGVLIYVMAMYTFYITSSAIRDMIKYRKLGSPIMSTAKVIKFASALVSMLSLETAMFSQFGEESSMQMMNKSLTLDRRSCNG